MAVLLFVLFWVFVAVALVALGIKSGRGSGGGVNAARGAGSRAYWYVGFALVALGFGVALPIAASLGRDSSSREVVKADISDLTEGQEHGRDLFRKYCSACHTLEAAHSVAQVGPNLDTLRPNKALIRDALKNGRARGNGAMARDLVVGKDAEDVADFVSAAVGQTDKG